MNRAARVRITVEQSEVLLVTASVATTTWSRMRGLLGRTGLDVGDGLVFYSCRMIHTWFMRFPIDVLFVDRHGCVVQLWESVQPFRLAWGGWRAAVTVELAAGALRESGVTVGQRVCLKPI